MPNVTHHTHHHPHRVHHGLTWYLLLVFSIAFMLILIVTVFPSINFPATVIDESHYREVARLEYMNGEKVLYTNPVELNSAVAAYHAGEKIVYSVPVALWDYRIGEKSAVVDIKALNTADVLYNYHMGEKITE